MSKQMILILCCTIAIVIFGVFFVQAVEERNREETRKEFVKDFQKRCKEKGGVVIDRSDKGKLLCVPGGLRGLKP